MHSCQPKLVHFIVSFLKIHLNHLDGFTRLLDYFREIILMMINGQNCLDSISLISSHSNLQLGFDSM
jgi:hypothetical protein